MTNRTVALKAPLCEAQSFPKGKVRICEYNADSVLRSYPFWEKDSQNLGCSPAPKEGSERECARDSRRNFWGGKKENKIKNRKSNWKLSQSFLFLLIVQVQRDPPFGIRLRQNTNALDPVHPSTDGLSHPFARITFCFLYKTSEYSE